jgi:hypothetical protein
MKASDRTKRGKPTLSGRMPMDANDTAAKQLQFSAAQIMIADLTAPGPAETKEALVEFLNIGHPLTSFALIRMSATVTGDPAGAHLLVLRGELPAWEAAAQSHGLRLLATAAPVRRGTWDGDATVTLDPQGNVIIQIPD